MYELMVEDIFDAAHQLRGYEGKCENLHGHTFRVQVFLQGEGLDNAGMLSDFKVIKENLSKVLDDFDHKNLNDLPDFKKINPTSENIARIIFNRLKPQLKVAKVSVWESPSSQASYSEGS